MLGILTIVKLAVFWSQYKEQQPLTNVNPGTRTDAHGLDIARQQQFPCDTASELISA
jgi:hypothetical protein